MTLSKLLFINFNNLFYKGNLKSYSSQLPHEVAWQILCFLNNNQWLMCVQGGVGDPVRGVERPPLLPNGGRRPGGEDSR